LLSMIAGLQNQAPRINLSATGSADIQPLVPQSGQAAATASNGQSSPTTGSAVTARTTTSPAAVAALPELPRVFIDTTYAAPAGGHIWTVNAGGNLQGALNSAQPGDTIVLRAGATFTGNFRLPNKTGSGWIYIISSDLSLLPAGRRVGPADAIHMPK